MPELLHPGVYVQEVPSAVRPIEGVSTSTAAFIGVANKGPIPGNVLPTGEAAQPQMVTSLTEYQRIFGSFRKDSFLTYAVRAFFDNGGRRAYIVRVADAATALAAKATLTPPLQLKAAHPGQWASLLRYDISQGAAAGEFNLTLRAQGMASADSLEQYSNLTPPGAQNAVNNASQYVRLPTPPTALPPLGTGLSLGGGTDDPAATPASATLAGATGNITVQALYPGVWPVGVLSLTVSTATDTLATDFDLTVQLGGKVVEQYRNLTFLPASGVAPANYGRAYVNARSQYIRFPADFSQRPNDAANVQFAGGSDGAAGVSATGPAPIAFSAANEGAWGNQIGIMVTSSSDRDPNNFRLGVWYGPTQVETYDRITYLGSPTMVPGADNQADYARTLINNRSDYIAITGDFDAVPLVGGPRLSLIGGADGTSAVSYIGAPAQPPTSGPIVTGTGVHALDKITDVNLITIPGQGDVATVRDAMDYCKNQRPLQDCFFIGDVGVIGSVDDARRSDAAPDPYKLADARDYATVGYNGVALDRSAGDYGAIYFPWVWTADPLGTGSNPRILLPPSGFVAGIYARIDNSRGFFKAPAGAETGVAGALAPLITVSDTDQDELNPISVNVIRTVPGSGIVVWGTRTIGSDSSWRYIPVRRVAIYLRVSIYNGIQWAVFEPNDEPLWAALRLNIRAFMLTQFRAGAFQGAKPDDAFFVKCDSTTTTQQDIDNGVVNILVGFAPLKPAEFVVLKLSQKINQPAQ